MTKDRLIRNYNVNPNKVLWKNVEVDFPCGKYVYQTSVKDVKGFYINKEGEDYSVVTNGNQMSKFRADLSELEEKGDKNED